MRNFDLMCKSSTQNRKNDSSMVFMLLALTLNSVLAIQYPNEFVIFWHSITRIHAFASNFLLCCYLQGNNIFQYRNRETFTIVYHTDIV